MLQKYLLVLANARTSLGSVYDSISARISSGTVPIRHGALTSPVFGTLHLSILFGEIEWLLASSATWILGGNAGRTAAIYGELGVAAHSKARIVDAIVVLVFTNSKLVETRISCRHKSQARAREADAESMGLAWLAFDRQYDCLQALLTRILTVLVCCCFYSYSLNYRTYLVSSSITMLSSTGLDFNLSFTTALPPQALSRATCPRRSEAVLHLHHQTQNAFASPFLNKTREQRLLIQKMHLASAVNSSQYKAGT